LALFLFLLIPIFAFLKIDFEFNFWYNNYMNELNKQEKKELDSVIKIIKEKPYLVWYVKNIENLSVESTVENIINWGDFEDIKKMIDVMGIEKVASIFYQQISRRRDNYKPEIKNYFQLYFNKYASRNIR
jgi:hypothetical protein